MSDSLRAESSSALQWSLYAGGYAFGCAALTAFLLSDLLGLFADVIGLPPVAGMPLLATPALVAGAVVWWALVERRDAPTYLRGPRSGCSPRSSPARSGRHDSCRSGASRC